MVEILVLTERHSAECWLSFKKVKYFFPYNRHHFPFCKMFLICESSVVMAGSERTKPTTHQCFRGHPDTINTGDPSDQFSVFNILLINTDTQYIYRVRIDKWCPMTKTFGPKATGLIKGSSRSIRRHVVLANYNIIQYNHLLCLEK